MERSEAGRNRRRRTKRESLSFSFDSVFNQSLEYSISSDCCQGSSSTFLSSKAQWFVTLCTYRLVFFLPFISSLKWAAFTLCGESSNAAERGRDTAVRIVTTRQEDGGKCSRQNAKVKRKSLLSVLAHALYIKLNVCACVCVCMNGWRTFQAASEGAITKIKPMSYQKLL